MKETNDMRIAHHCLLTLLAVTIAYPIVSPAQEAPPPMEWGEIPQEQLAMTSFAADSNATAVILCDYGETSLTNDVGVAFTRHRRIKILTKAGFDWGTHSVVIYTKDHTQRIDDIEAVTYSLGPDGKVVETEMDDDAIFKEDVDGSRTRIRFTLPALTPGCVIEYRYSIYSESLWFIRDWEFQTSEPVVWSEYRLTTPPQIAYSAVLRGYEKFAISENIAVNSIFQGQMAGYLGSQMVRCNHLRWAVANAPAIRHEPFITTTDDYIDKVSLQLAGYAFAGGGGVQRVLKDWESIVEELLDSRDFSKRIDVTGDVQDATARVTAGLTTQIKKVKAIYDFVRKTIVWSGFHRIYADKTVDDILETKSGNNAEISFLLISMLQSAGIPATPVLLSTRENGMIQKLYPILNQFNYVICRAMIDGRPVFLDATDPFRAMSLLSPEVLNTEGLLIQEGPVAWVRIESPMQFVHKSVADISLHDDGSIAGSLESSDEDYSALEKRRGLKDKKDVDIVKEAFLTDETGITVDSVEITGRDSVEADLKLRAEISSDQYANVAGDLIYINPLIIDRKKDNPLKLRIRKFPVDMAYGIRTTTVINLKTPTGYVVKEALADKVVRFQDNGAVYSRKCAVENGIIHVVSDLSISQSYYPPGEYQKLRSFYADMLSLQNDQIVLQKAATGKSK